MLPFIIQFYFMLIIQNIIFIWKLINENRYEDFLLIQAINFLECDILITYRKNTFLSLLL